MNDLLKSSCQELEHLAKKKRLKLELRAFDCTVFVDPNRTMQVIVNLLANAVRFSPEGKSITLSIAESQSKILCKIQDEGLGVPLENQAAIFEKFGQPALPESNQEAGSGLSLPICKQIIEDQGGEIGVESQEGSGSTFWFSLPREAILSAALLPQNAKLASGLKQEAAQQAILSTQVKKRSALRLPLAASGAAFIGVPLLFQLLLAGTLSSSLIEFSPRLLLADIGAQIALTLLLSWQFSNVISRRPAVMADNTVRCARG